MSATAAAGVLTGSESAIAVDAPGVVFQIGPTDDVEAYHKTHTQCSNH
jgi:hypothetical protein